MTVLELYEKLTERVPKSLSCPWDGDGFEICPDKNNEVKKVLCSLDVTNDVIDYAIEGGFDVIVAHHPMLFNGIKEVSELRPDGERTVKCVRNNIAVMTFHTRLDAVEGGVNDTLASLVGLENVYVGEGCDGIMRVGELPDEMDALEFAHKVKEALGAPVVTLSRHSGKVKKVGLVGGSGGSGLVPAKACGADTFLTGDLKYHEIIAPHDSGMNLVVAGHSFTEYPVCQVLKGMIGEIDPLIDCEVYFSDRVEVI
jgi:dinuclear metal center YbgI/SA1388 family protein